MGKLSAKYESSGNPGTIANNKGDIGGASYGTYQIATNTGTMNSFLSWAKNSASAVYKALSGKSPGSAAFNSAWKALASSNPAAFESVQRGFIQSSHYTPALSKVKASTGVDVSKLSPAMQNVLWSVSVQHGVGGANSVFKNSGIKPNMSEAEMIRRIYTERAANGGKKYFPNSSESIRKSVVNRFKDEVVDALGMLV